jgi:hypothetical protein
MLLFYADVRCHYRDLLLFEAPGDWDQCWSQPRGQNADCFCSLWPGPEDNLAGAADSARTCPPRRPESLRIGLSLSFFYGGWVGANRRYPTPATQAEPELCLSSRMKRSKLRGAHPNFHSTKPPLQHSSIQRHTLTYVLFVPRAEEKTITMHRRAPH